MQYPEASHPCPARRSRFSVGGRLEQLPFLLASAVLCGCGSYDSALLLSPGVCGNGTLEIGERCDTAISEGARGSCPDVCPNDMPCTRARVVGEACQRRCEREPVRETRDGDACCPEGGT